MLTRSPRMGVGLTIMWIVALIVLGGTGVIGIHNGFREWDGAITFMQKTVTLGVFLYGITGVVAAIGLAMRRRWSVWAALAWLVPITYVPGTATIHYGGAGIGAALAASISTGLFAAAIVWMTHTVIRRHIGE